MKMHTIVVLAVAGMLCTNAFGAPPDDRFDKSNLGQPFAALSDQLTTLATPGAKRWISPWAEEINPPGSDPTCDPFEPGGCVQIWVVVLNLGRDDVDITVNFYSQDGELAFQRSDVLRPRHNVRIGIAYFPVFSGWVEVVASDNVLVEGTIESTNIVIGEVRPGGGNTEVADAWRSLTWYRLPENVPQR